MPIMRKLYLILILGLVAGGLLLPPAAMAEEQYKYFEGKFIFDGQGGDAGIMDSAFDWNSPRAKEFRENIAMAQLRAVINNAFSIEVFTLNKGEATSWELDGLEPADPNAWNQNCSEAMTPKLASFGLPDFMGVTVATTCNGQPQAAVGKRDSATGATPWNAVQMNGIDEADAIDVATYYQDDQPFQTICVSTNGSLHCGDIPVGEDASSDVDMKPMGWGPIGPDGTRLQIAMAANGDMHAVSTTADGGLIYGEFPQGSTQAVNTQTLGDPADDWDWPAVGVGPEETVWVSAHSKTRGNLTIWHGASETGWTVNEINPDPGDQVGMHNSMGVDPVTGIAHFTYAHSSGRTKFAQVGPDGSVSWTWLDASWGQAYATSTLAYNGEVAHFFAVDGTLNEWWQDFGD